MEKQKVLFCKHETRLQPIHSHSVSGPDYSSIYPLSVFSPLQIEKRKIQKTNNKSKKQKNPASQLVVLKPELFLYILFFASPLGQTTWLEMVFCFSSSSSRSPHPFKTGNRNTPITQTVTETTFSDEPLQLCFLLRKSCLFVCSTNKR